VRTPIDQTKLEIHFHDRFQLPEARVDLGELIMYLADLGLRTNPDGFWALAQTGLHILPGTILVEKRMEGGLTHPILVVAKPAVEHPVTILLRFNEIPTPCKRTNKDFEPFWIPVPTPPTSPANEATTPALEDFQQRLRLKSSQEGRTSQQRRVWKETYPVKLKRARFMTRTYASPIKALSNAGFQMGSSYQSIDSHFGLRTQS
jgi:hypothetical protein